VGRHLLQPASAGGLAGEATAVVQRPPSATTHADAGKRDRRSTTHDTGVPASERARRRAVVSHHRWEVAEGKDLPQTENRQMSR
jgi:hypothetical protein